MSLQCHYDYACSFWYSGLPQLLRRRLQVIQNRMIRFVLKLALTYKIRWFLFFRVVVSLEKGRTYYTFRIKSGTLPDYMEENSIPASSAHNSSTRFRENGKFLFPKVKGFGRKSFAFTSCSPSSNGLPPNLANIIGLKYFKTAVISLLLNSFWMELISIFMLGHCKGTLKMLKFYRKSVTCRSAEMH